MLKKLSTDTLMDVSLKVILPICIMVKVAMLEIDPTLVLMVIFLVGEYIRCKVKPGYSNFNIFYICMMTIVSLSQALTAIIKMFVS